MRRFSDDDFTPFYNSCFLYGIPPHELVQRLCGDITDFFEVRLDAGESRICRLTDEDVVVTADDVALVRQLDMDALRKGSDALGREVVGGKDGGRFR